MNHSQSNRAFAITLSCISIFAGFILTFTYPKFLHTTPITGARVVPQAIVKMRIAQSARKAAPTPIAQQEKADLDGASTIWAGASTSDDAVALNLSTDLKAFVRDVTTGKEDVVSGVYVEGALKLPIMQQPEGQSAYVSDKDGMVTQFSNASRNGVTGLLAHNYLSGAQFYNLVLGQEVWIVYGDGDLRRYQIVEYESYQKLTPSSLQSQFIELDTGEELSTNQVFSRFYKGDHKVTFQTCLANEGISNWGLSFWVAEPVQ
jgi:hypothetical protein